MSADNKPSTDTTEISDDPEAVLQRMREVGLPVVHSFFATIYRRTSDRPDGYSDEELDEIAAELSRQDIGRWQEELKAHLEKEQSN